MQRMIGIGSALVDVLANVPESFLARVPGDKGGMCLIDRGEMTDLLRALPAAPERVPGGSAANTVVGAARLGVNARLLTKIGNDEPGGLYRRAVAAAGVETSAFKVHATEATGSCICLVTPDSQRTMRTYLGAAATLAAEEVTVADFAGCTHAHIEGYMLFDAALMRKTLQTARAAGCTVSVDLASREVVQAAGTLLPTLLREGVDMVFANEDEAAAFANTDDEEAALETLASLCELAVVKLGARGALIRRGSDRVRIAAERVSALDTTGAGDLWAAGFLAGLLAGRDLKEAGEIGAHVGALVVQRLGASMPASQWDSVRRRFGLEPGG